MPCRLSRLTCLCVLLLALAPPLLAQEAPTVSITPPSGAVEQAAFDIQISGLAAKSAFTVEILFEGEVVFSSDETSNAAGKLSYPISSTEGDLPGVYTLRVVSAGEVVASAEFALTAADASEAEAGRDFLGNVRVTPATAPFGKVQTIRIGELEELTNYTVEITASESLQVAYRRVHPSDEDGVIEIEVFAEAGDAAGLQAIAVYDQEGEAVAEGEFTIEAPPERDAVVALNPAFIAAGGETEIAVTGLAAFDSVTAQITSAEGILIDTILARASSDGAVTLRFAADADMVPGAYAVEIFVDGDKLAAAELSVGELEQQAQDLRLTVDPPSGDIGTEHKIAVSGLAAEQIFALVILDPAGGEEHRSARNADAAGEFSLTISSAADDDIGDYRVEIRQTESDELLAEASFAVDAAAEVEEVGSEESEDSASVTIDPQAAALGSSHLVRVSGLRPNETVDIDVRFAGASVYRTEKRADSAGRVQLELETSDEDEIGDYTITVLRAAGNQPSALLTATAKAAAIVSTIAADAEVIESRLQDGRAEIKFTGAAGQVALISVASHDFDPAVALIDRDDVEMGFSDDSRGRKDALIGPLSLPYAGDYRLEVSAAPLMMPQGAIDGEFVVTIAEASLTPLAFEQGVAFSLSADAPAQYFALPVEIGDSLTVTLDSGGALDTLLQLVAPSGLEYAFDDDSGSGFDAELSGLVFDRAATYALAVSTFDGAASGTGTVTVRRNPVQALEDGAARVTLNDKAIRDLVVFDAAEDEYLILNLRKLKGDVEDLYVTARVEGMEVMAYSTMGVPDELPLAFVMPMSGHVVVTLEKFGFDDGIALEVSLARP